MTQPDALHPQFWTAKGNFNWINFEYATQKYIERVYPGNGVASTLDSQPDALDPQFWVEGRILHWGRFGRATQAYIEQKRPGVQVGAYLDRLDREVERMRQERESKEITSNPDCTKIIQKYVLIYCSRVTQNKCIEVLVIHKDRPKWQSGRLNLPGGKIEEGETVDQAGVREFFEETGLHTKCHKTIGMLVGNDYEITVLRAWLVGDDKIAPRQGETEIPEWMGFETLLKDPRLIPNLKIIIPLAEADVTDWVISEDVNSLKIQMRACT